MLEEERTFPPRQVKRGDLSNKVTGEDLIVKDSSYVVSNCCDTAIEVCLFLCEMPVFWVNL